MSDHPGLPKGIRHFVRIQEVQCLAALDTPLPEGSQLTLTPVIGGAGGGDSTKQILIGLFLVAISFMIPGAAAAAGKLTASGFLKAGLFNIGVSLVLGGVLAQMARAPKADPTSGEKRSRFINGTGNTVAVGTPIALIFGGPIRVGGHYLHFDVDAEDYVP